MVHNSVLPHLQPRCCWQAKPEETGAAAAAAAQPHLQQHNKQMQNSRRAGLLHANCNRLTYEELENVASCDKAHHVQAASAGKCHSTVTGSW
jgi:hypothetical protein